MIERLANVYLWVALPLAVPVGMARNLAGTGALLAAYLLFVALTGTILWKVGAAKGASGSARGHPAFLPGVLLFAGPLALALGASVTGEPTAARPGDYVLNTTAILVGSLVLVGGFAALSARLWEAGGRLLPALGLAVLLAGTAVWLANLVFRYAVVASGAAPLQAGAEDRAWVAHEYLRGLPGRPSWMELLLVWTDMLQLAFVLLAYLASGLLGAAMVGSGWLGRIGGGLFAATNLALFVVVAAGIALAGAGSAAAAWTAYVLTIPFAVFVLPYLVGVALIRRAGQAHEATNRAGASAARVPLPAPERG